MFQAARFGTSHDLGLTKRTSSVADPPSMLPMEKFTQPKCPCFSRGAKNQAAAGEICHELLKN